MATQIDAIGKACPMPVVLAKKALDGGEEDLTVLVDNATAVENLTRLAESQGMTVQARSQGGNFAVQITGKRIPGPEPEPISCTLTPSTARDTVFIGKDFVGDGDRELGRNLMKMFLYTLSESDTPPRCLLFMNSGVKLPAGEEPQVLENLRDLEHKGCEILVCGTCLNFFGLTDACKIGLVSNMYDIVTKMQSAEKIISI